MTISHIALNDFFFNFIHSNVVNWLIPQSGLAIFIPSSITEILPAARLRKFCHAFSKITPDT